MKIIGVEFRVRMDTFQNVEVFLHPLDITFELPQRYPFGPRCNVTVHTTRGDVTADLGLEQLLPNMMGGVTTEEARKAYDSLVAQVERIRR